MFIAQLPAGYLISLPWRIRLPKPLVLLGIGCLWLALLLAYLPKPTLRQPLSGANARGWMGEAVYHPHLLNKKEMSC
jgi:hypothetical protein